jgi:hypothetical protein
MRVKPSQSAFLLVSSALAVRFALPSERESMSQVGDSLANTKAAKQKAALVPQRKSKREVGCGTPVSSRIARGHRPTGSGYANGVGWCLYPCTSPLPVSPSGGLWLSPVRMGTQLAIVHEREGKITSGKRRPSTASQRLCR